MLMLFPVTLLIAAGLPTEAELQTLLATTSASNGLIGMEASVVLPSGKVLTANAGVACASPVCFPPKAVTQSSTFCFGSATKMLTAISILHKVDQKVITLDDLALPLMEDFLRRGFYNVSLPARLGPEIAQTTIRHLMSMRSGVPDYDNPASRSWQLQHPHTDMDPALILNKFVKPGFTCPPGTCGEYSTTNYVLLGLVLAALNNATRWEDLDQIAILPPAAAPLLSLSHFPTHGPCSKVAGMVHGITFNGLVPVDTWGVSCTNGWTGGNWAGRTRDAAQVAHALWAGGAGGTGTLVSAELADQMRRFEPLDTGSFKVPYGLGAMDLGSQLGGVFTRPEGAFYGHGGETFGFTGYMGFVPKVNASLAVFANAEDVLATSEAAAGVLTFMGV